MEWNMERLVMEAVELPLHIKILGGNWNGPLFVPGFPILID